MGSVTGSFLLLYHQKVPLVVQATRCRHDARTDHAQDFRLVDLGDDNEGVVMYERTQDGVTYLICGNRRYEVTARGNLRYVGDVAPVPAPTWLHRLWAWVRGWL